MADRLVDPEANNKRIENVEKCFFGSLTQPLMEPNRILVGEGVLTKMCRKKPKPRQFFLFDDLLVYGTIVIARKKIKYFLWEMPPAGNTLGKEFGYNSMHVIDLAEVKLQSLDDDGVLKNGWQIISPKKSFSVYAATAQEKVEWMAHINRCVQDLKAKRGITSSTTDDSPVWIPDSEANKCMVCNKSEFTVLNRKHHCRKCGRVVCNPCSTKRWLLPSQSTKPQRVCDACYDKLNRMSGLNDQQEQLATQIAAEETSDSSSEDDEVAQQAPSSPNAGTNNQPPEPHFYESSDKTSHAPYQASATIDVTNDISATSDAGVTTHGAEGRSTTV